MFEIILLALLPILLGVAAGIVTGILPGIHVNLVAVIFLDIVLLFDLSPVTAAVFIISVAITHIIIDFIPSTFLGAPDPDKALLLLPAHTLLMQGEGLRAIHLAIGGCLLSLIGGSVVTIFSLPILSFIAPYLQKGLPFVVGGISLFLLANEESWDKRLYATMIFLLAGLLGFISLNSSIQDPLLAIFSGAFGIAGLFMSIQEDHVIPEQKNVTGIEISNTKGLQAVVAATCSGVMTGFLPGIGASQGMSLVSVFVKEADHLTYLIAIGGVSMVNFVFSFATWAILNKARNGVVVTLQSMLSTIDSYFIFGLIGVCFIAAGLSAILALPLARIFVNVVKRIHYPFLCIGVIGFMAITVFVFSSYTGFLVMMISAAVGLLSSTLRVHKIHIMGCLLLPYLLHAMGF